MSIIGAVFAAAQVVLAACGVDDVYALGLYRLQYPEVMFGSGISAVTETNQ